MGKVNTYVIGRKRLKRELKCPSCGGLNEFLIPLSEFEYTLYQTGSIIFDLVEHGNTKYHANKLNFSSLQLCLELLTKAKLEYDVKINEGVTSVNWNNNKEVIVTEVVIKRKK